MNGDLGVARIASLLLDELAGADTDDTAPHLRPGHGGAVDAARLGRAVHEQDQAEVVGGGRRKRGKVGLEGDSRRGFQVAENALAFGVSISYRRCARSRSLWSWTGSRA